MSAFKMYIFVNGDLNMSIGKMTAQCCHVTHMIVDELVRDGYENYPPSVNYVNYLKWNKNCTKIILKATESQLKELLQSADARSFYDNGLLTAIGFVPTEINKFEEYKLI